MYELYRVGRPTLRTPQPGPYGVRPVWRITWGRKTDSRPREMLGEKGLVVGEQEVTEGNKYWIQAKLRW